MSAKQKNSSEAPRKRGRPKKVGELKESSVRIRPALKERLEAAAAESGESIARELEGRLEASFTEVRRHAATHALLQEIATAAQEVEAITGKPWNKDLVTWAMLRERLANGPIVDALPHPDADKARELVAMNAELAELMAERSGLIRSLLPFTVLGGDEPTLGSRWNPPATAPDRKGTRDAIKERDDLPADIREALLAQVERLEELEPEIAELGGKVKRAMLPYMQARDQARQMLYGMRGMPDLPTWLTAPVGMDEQPKRSPLPAAGRR